MGLKWPTGYRLNETRLREAALSDQMAFAARLISQRNFHCGQSSVFRFKGVLPPKTGKAKRQVRWYRSASTARAAERQAWAAHAKREGKSKKKSEKRLARLSSARAGAGA